LGEQTGQNPGPMSATMVEGYRHHPGHHCGSTALRNLLAFAGVEISEEMALALEPAPASTTCRSTGRRRRG